MIKFLVERMIVKNMKWLATIVLINSFWMLGQALANIDSDLEIISSSDNQLVIEYKPGNIEWSNVDVNGRTYRQVSFDHAVNTSETGQPLLPSRMITLGIPQKGDITVQLLDSESTTLRDVALAPVPDYTKNEQGEYQPVYTIGEEYKALQKRPVEKSSTIRFRQQRVARLVINPVDYDPESNKVMIYTKMRIQITFPASAAVTRYVKKGIDEEMYQVMLVNYEQSRSWRIPEKSSLYKAQNHILTGDNWYKFSIKGDGVTIKSDVENTPEGMYKITGSTLEAAGISLSDIGPSSIQLFNNGGKEQEKNFDTAPQDTLIENAILVVGGEDGVFNESDYILFYGRSMEGVEYNGETGMLEHYFNHYEENNVYWLTWGKTTGKRIATRQSFPLENAEMQTSFRDLAYFEREEHNVYNSGIIWLDRSLSTANKSRNYTFELKNVVSESLTVVRPALALLSTDWQRFTVRINNNSHGSVNPSISWSGPERFNLFRTTWDLYGVLMDGTNTVSVQYNSTDDTDMAYTDFIELEYARELKAVNDQLVFWGPRVPMTAGFQVTDFSSTPDVYDITDFSNIVKIAGTTTGSQISFADDNNSFNPKRYVALASDAYKTIESEAFTEVELTDLRTPRQVDYIIITHDDFEQQAHQLESLRENWNQEDRLETEVVRISDVITEFGYGMQDPCAIRNFIYYAQNNWGNPYYVLLLGDGHFDYKDIRGTGVPNLVMPYEVGGNLENRTRATDDWYVYTRGVTNGSQMAIGRICVNTVDQAQNVVDKIRIYETEPEYGDWRNKITIVGDDEIQTGDDEDQTNHTREADNLSKIVNIQPFDIKKIYLVEYRPVKTASISGITKPDARRDLLDQINSGALLINYVGHGNDQRWAHEKVLYGPTDFDLIQNGRKQALWVAATCEFARWDQIEEQSLSEEVAYAKDRGAIGVVATSRLVYSNWNYPFNRDFLMNLFSQYNNTGKTLRLGDALLKGKVGIFYQRVNTEKFLLIGDPAMRLAAPKYKVEISDITPDSIQALQKMTIAGRVLKDGVTWTDFQGKIKLSVLDSPKSTTYYTVYTNTPITYDQTGNTLFRGTATVTDGQFKIEFIVPKDISYDGTDGRVNVYFWNDNGDGQGSQGGLVVGGTATNLVDHENPELLLHFGNPDFSPGDYVPVNPVLHVDITDSLSGINTAGDIGHQIMLTLDDDINSSKDVTEYFEYKEGSYVAGTVTYLMQEISEGPHTIKVKAWDNSNNSGVVESEFTIVVTDKLLLTDLINYPNPMSSDTQFTFNASQDAMAEISIYTVAGRLIRKFGPTPIDVGYNVFPERWDGRDQDGDKVANGVYLYKIKAKTQSGESPQSAEEIGKLIIAR